MNAKSESKKSTPQIFEGLCFIEQITPGSLTLEVIKQERMVFTPEQILRSQSIFLLLPILTEDKLVKGLVEKYYYRFSIHNEERENSFGVHINSCPDIASLVGKFSIEDNHVVWLTFDYDYKITKLMIELVSQYANKLKQVESFYRGILQVSQQKAFLDNKFNSWVRTLTLAHENLGRLFEGQDREFEFTHIIQILKSLRPFFDAEKWTETESKIFIETLQEIQLNIDSASLANFYSRLMGLPGLGIGTVSAILHSLWKDRFAVFSQELYGYLNFLGYFGGTPKNGADLYEIYRVEISEIINVIFDGLEIEPYYHAISYYFKKFKPYHIV